MKRVATDAQQQEVQRKRYKRHALNEKVSSWVDSFLLPDELKLDAKQFDALWTLHPAELGQVKLYGKLQDTPRWQQSYGQPYRFSGLDHAAQPVPAPVQRYLDYANSLPQYKTPRGSFNMALLNWYQDGRHHIGYHADDESQMLADTPVFSLSFGQPRPLSLRPKKGVKDGKQLKVEMPDNSVLVMGGACQKTHKHAVLKVEGKKGAAMGRRINMTFRMFVEKK